MKPTYEPQDIEARWYPVWEDAGAFRPEINPAGEPFSIVIPPPNVTGILHMGHALDQSIQDVIIRRKRMQGYAALWLPGTDHAGIATQNVVERELAAEGITRHDLGREAFVEQVWEWKRRSGSGITKQMRRMGFSTDWSRERFTLDEGLSTAVRTVFVTLYHEGLIYRGRRIINWCPRCHTAISDIEVDHEDEIGELVHIRYPFPSGGGGIVVATTRPETMLGDTGVAVHPDDERYRDVVGRTVVLPLVNREIPIVADEAVAMDFGTGAVKVTPAHDAVDFEIGERHGLEPIIVIDLDGKITKEGGEYFGQDRFEAREVIRHDLEKRGFLVGTEEHRHSVGHCSRCGTVVEPLLSEQWFVKVGPLADPAIASVKEGRTVFWPRRWENNYFRWMEGLRDWTISRQLWWGHQIPAWYCDACGEVIVSLEDPTECTGCGGTELRRDEDVLDTWFSSALFPFSTMGWPHQTADLERFYPTDVLVTGFDIITFWVSRMMMMGVHFTGTEPFRDVVIHGMVRDVDGRKMSKSFGNVMDPLDLADQYGADSLRLALLQAAAPGHDVPLDEQWVAGTRKFGNKLWNAVRFAVEHSGVSGVPIDGGYPDDPGPEDAWILQRLAEIAAEVDSLLEEFRIADAYGALYNFTWSEVFDWYIEMAKAPLRDPERAATTKATLGVVLRDLLKLFHPAIPFVTEELWSHLGSGDLLITARWPRVPPAKGPSSMATFQELVTEVRRFRSEHQLSPRAEIEMVLVDPSAAGDEWWDEQLVALTNTRPIPGAPPTAGGYSRIVAGSVEGYVPLAGIVDVAAERDRLGKAAAEAEVQLQRVEQKLGNASFLERAPAAVVAKERAKRDELMATAEKLRAQLGELG